MYTIDERHLNQLLRKKFSSLVGKTCKRLEIIRDSSAGSFKEKVELFRDLIKELDYEAMRDLEECIASFSDGTKIQVTLIKPER